MNLFVSSGCTIVCNTVLVTQHEGKSPQGGWVPELQVLGLSLALQSTEALADLGLRKVEALGEPS